MPVNTAALKTFAPAMRRQLLEAVGRKLDLLLYSLTPDTLSTYAKQIAELREQEAENREQLLERVAYTWFNRLCALRYLDARGWHPFGCKVLMPGGEGETQPELLKLMRAGNLPADLQSHTDEDRLHGLLDGQVQTAITGADPQGEVYRQLVLAVCRCYHKLLPNLFEGLDDASELLLPDDLLSDGSILGAFRKEITDDDCQDIESLGWLYQFYIAEKKDEVMARKKAVPSEDIPAVTQLFTPHWIVRYLVENSLGRLWLLNRPGSRLREHMPYYIEGEAEKEFLEIAKPEEIKLLDPACGSGHMLTYAFDLLVLIYEEEGYSPNEIPGLILEHNLHGLEICPRAAQLAQFALVCKAREQSRTAFRRPVQPQVMCLQNVVISPEEMQSWMGATGLKLSQEELTQIHQFQDNTETFGSLIQPVLDGEKLAALAARIGEQAPARDLLVQNIHRKLRLVLVQAGMLSQRYQVVVANPPYMGGETMSDLLQSLFAQLYPNSTANLFAGFVERVGVFGLDGSACAMITMHNWMFLKSFIDFRKELLHDSRLIQLLHLGARSFDSISGEVVQTAAFVFSPRCKDHGEATFFRLTEGKSEAEKEIEFRKRKVSGAFNHLPPRQFDSINGSPVAYWLTPAVFKLFEQGMSLADVSEAREGLSTGNNDRHVRLWSEVSCSNAATRCENREVAKGTGRKWFAYNKGGTRRRWYGNADFVVNWANDGHELQTTMHASGKRIWAHNFNLDYIFKPAVSWSDITTKGLVARYYPHGFIFDATGLSAFFDDQEMLLVVLSLLNTKFADTTAQVLNPTLHFKTGDYRRLPFPKDYDGTKAGSISASAIAISRADWDNFETSWDFCDLPLLRSGDWEVEPGQPSGPWKGRTLAESWDNYASYCSAATRRMQELETENNRLWIDAYGLQDELTPEVPKDEITLARADKAKDVAAFLSYATGCMMGRYSLDQPGLILADSRDSQSEQLTAYEEKVGKPLSLVKFKPDPDGIIPVLDGEWFEDDIVARTREFLDVTFPESSVGENLRFIEESLSKDIRKYFCTEFYKDHLQTYKKRPIYWMVQSPKKGFACLIYLHRYTKDTLNQVLNKYFRRYMLKLDARLTNLEREQLDPDQSASKRTAAHKEVEKITRALKECQAWEQDSLLPLAQQRIEIDLDEGVKVNYLKLQDVLAPIPGLAAKED